MKLYELLRNIEIQSEYKVVYVEQDAYERTEILDTINEDSIYYYKEINYIYCENDILYIEIEID